MMYDSFLGLFTFNVSFFRKYRRVRFIKTCVSVTVVPRILFLNHIWKGRHLKNFTPVYLVCPNEVDADS